jgi:hypothetical protein
VAVARLANLKIGDKRMTALQWESREARQLVDPKPPQQNNMHHALSERR